MTEMQKLESKLYSYGLIAYCSVTDEVQSELLRLKNSTTYIRIWRSRNDRNSYFTKVDRIEFNV